PPPAVRLDMVVVLPDPETGAVGGAVVSSPLGGAGDLTSDRPATRIAHGQNPNAPLAISDVRGHQLFDDAPAAQPPAPRDFLLYFRFKSDLTPESETLLTEILAFVKSRPAPDVTVIGHTDTVGTTQSNIDLGRTRATMIRDRLVAVGIDANLISVTSHGE